MNFDYQFFYEGFFGYSLEQDFSYWSIWHFLPILLLGVAIYLTYRYRDKLRAWKWEDHFTTILGVILILNEAFYYWRLLYVGNGGSSDPEQLITYLPLQVCEWSAYLCAFMLLKKNRHLFDICFYITLTLGLIPLVTPAVIMQTGPLYARYYQFWLEHLLPIYGVFYMMFVHGMRPDYKKVYKPLGVLSLLTTLAIIANKSIEGANFMYMSDTTAGDSLANILPQNIWLRLLVGIAIVVVLFTLISLPQIIGDIKRLKKAAVATASQEDTPTETEE